MDQMLAIILGGGAGTRLQPLTTHRAKPAVPLAGKYRLVDVPISNCINSGLDRIFVLTQFNSASLNSHVARSYRFDRFRSGFVTVLAAEQTPSSKAWYQGTADAVRQSLPHTRSIPHEHVIILSGDQLYSMDYRAMLAHHKEHGADVTVATTPVTADEASAFGILKTNDNHAITEFHEKPPRDELEGKDSPVSEEMERAGRIYLASMGIYIFGGDVLRDMLDEDEDAHDFGKEIIPDAIENRRVISYPFTSYWSDIGTVKSFFEANIMLAQPQPDFNLYDPAMPLYTNARMLAPAKVERSHVENAIISEGSVIAGAKVSDSVVGLRSYIGRGASLHRTVMMGADYYPWEAGQNQEPAQGPRNPGIGAGTRVENAIIDRNVAIGTNCVITNAQGLEEGEGPGYQIRDGVIVIEKNVEIPDGTVI
jgi:glucose-1-phosphate adenylyltransferase